MTVLEEIENKLKEYNISYNKIEHLPVVTSEEAAHVRKTDMRFGAKALVFFADGIPIMIVVSGDRKVSIKDFKRLFFVKDLELINETDLKRLTSIEKGAIPPFGSIFGFKTYCDEKLKEIKNVVFNAGSRCVSIEMLFTDYVRVESPIFGYFSKL